MFGRGIYCVSPQVILTIEFVGVWPIVVFFSIFSSTYFAIFFKDRDLSGSFVWWIFLGNKSDKFECEEMIENFDFTGWNIQQKLEYSDVKENICL